MRFLDFWVRVSISVPWFSQFATICKNFSLRQPIGLFNVCIRHILGYFLSYKVSLSRVLYNPGAATSLDSICVDVYSYFVRLLICTDGCVMGRFSLTSQRGRKSVRFFVQATGREMIPTRGITWTVGACHTYNPGAATSLDSICVDVY